MAAAAAADCRGRRSRTSPVATGSEGAAEETAAAVVGGYAHESDGRCEYELHVPFVTARAGMLARSVDFGALMRCEHAVIVR